MAYSDLLIIALALSAGAFAKGATGLGLPLISLPVLASFLGLAHAISVLVIPIIVTNAWQVWRFRSERSSHQVLFVWPMIIASTVGAALGTWILAVASERVLVLILAATIFAYIALRLLRQSFILGTIAARRAAAPVGVLGGMFQGATGISSPISATFIHAMNLDYRSFVFALSSVFLASTLMQAIALATSGILQWPWIAEGIFALLPVLLVMPLGQRLGAYISKTAFNRLILVFLAVIGASLVLDV